MIFFLINNAEQVIALPGSTLYNLEKKLKKFDRAPHSEIGSSCIGASIVGGICNNSGGALIKRGPAYTELSLFANVNNEGELELVNNLGIDLGKTPEQIFRNLDNGTLPKDKYFKSNKKASSVDYKNIIKRCRCQTLQQDIMLTKKVIRCIRMCRKRLQYLL